MHRGVVYRRFRSLRAAFRRVVAVALRRWRALLLAIGAIHPTADERAKRLGARGERAAAAYLRRSGYRVLGRNLLLQFGEADILALAPDGHTIVLVEVKTRLRPIDGPALSMTVAPEAAVTAEKHRKLRAILESLSRANAWHDRPRRIDVIGVEWREDRPRDRPVLRHHEGI